MYDALYASIAAHLRLGLNVVTDVAHHDNYATLSGILYDCAGRLEGLNAYFVGVRCPAEVVWQRRKDTWLKEEDIPDDAPVPELVRIWDREVHKPGVYDLEVDTSKWSGRGLCRQDPGAYRNESPAGCVQAACHDVRMKRIDQL